MARAPLILGMLAVTFLTRYLMIALLGRWQLPQAALRWLSFIPIAAFTAIAVQGTLAPGGELRIDPRSPYIWGGVAAVLVAWRTKNVVLTIVAGLAALWVARLCLGG